MKKNISEILIITMLIYAGCINKQNQNIPVLVSSPFEWGTSFIGDTIKAEISCVNLKNEDIVIDYITTPCGCITAIPRWFVNIPEILQS